MSAERELNLSIIRRSVIVLSFTLPGLVLNLALIYLAAELFSGSEFGIFYVSISIINTLVAPSLILSMFYARHFVTVAVAGGRDQTIAAFLLALQRFLRWGTPMAGLVLAILIGIGYMTGVNSIAVIGLIVLIAFAAYFADLVRAAFQSLQEFAALGAFGFIWMLLRLVLSGGAILMTGTVWAGLSGILLAGFVTFAVAAWLLVRERDSAAKIVAAEDPSLGTVPTFFLSYALLISIVYLDVMLGYLFLDPIDLSAYSASSVLPKGIIVATAPVVQVFFTTYLLSRRSEVPLKAALVVKSFALTTLLAGGAVGLLMVLPEPFCGGQYGISFCEADAMGLIALSALPLCILRVVVLTQLARSREWHPLLLSLPTAVFIGFVASGEMSVTDLARNFAVYSFGLLVFYVLISRPMNVLRRYIYSSNNVANEGTSSNGS